MFPIPYDKEFELLDFIADPEQYSILEAEVIQRARVVSLNYSNALEA